MRATDLIETNIRPHCQSIHKTRFDVLQVAIEAALTGRCVTVTGLGRRSPRAVTEKASIKQMDLLVGNKHLPGEAPVLYGAMARWIVRKEKRPLIVVDWSVLSADEKFHVLRASVPAGGRGKTLYQEVHPQEHYGSPEVQLEFLCRLSQVLPPDCRPVVVTDAGFKNPQGFPDGKFVGIPQIQTTCGAMRFDQCALPCCRSGHRPRWVTCPLWLR